MAIRNNHKDGENEMNILLIVASGKSSRFGGFPKAFCQIGDRTNSENTIMHAKKFYDKIYIGVNRNTYQQFHGIMKDCEMFSIVTGQGDAHSMLKCLMHIKDQESNVKNITVCWGDALFVDDTPFIELLNKVQDTKVSVACALDKKPYAWFDINDEGEILHAHFAKEEGFINEGLHDQSLFNFDFDFALTYLSEYRKSLGIPNNNDENRTYINEMKLLHSFEYLYKTGYKPAKCIQVSANKVLSFNTREELEYIKKILACNGEH